MNRSICSLAVNNLNESFSLLIGWSHLHGNTWTGGVSLRLDAAVVEHSLTLTPPHAGIATVAFFNANDSHIVAAGDSGTLAIWRRADATAGAAPAFSLHRAHDDIITAIASRDSLPLLTASFDATVRLWPGAAATTPSQSSSQAQSAAAAITFSGHTDAVLDVKWSSENTFVSCSRDSTAALWDVRTAPPQQPRATQVFRLAQRCALNTVDVTPHGFVAGTADGRVLGFDLRRADAQPLLIHKSDNSINRVLFQSQSNCVVFVDDDGKLAVVDDSLVARTLLQHRSPLRALAIDRQSNIYVGSLHGDIEKINSS
jgi:WD40 repeat protein